MGQFKVHPLTDLPTYAQCGKRARNPRQTYSAKRYSWSKKLFLQVYLDGGIREGTDVFKALALGAKLVFIGRPITWGLAWAGQKGVEKTLDLVREELDLTMALSGCDSVSKITRDMVVAKRDLI